MVRPKIPAARRKWNRFDVRVDDETYRALERYIRRTGEDRSGAIRRMVIERLVAEGLLRR